MSKTKKAKPKNFSVPMWCVYGDGGEPLCDPVSSRARAREVASYLATPTRVFRVRVTTTPV